MNVEDYISSGILESYVMDQLTVDQCTEVEEMSAKHPEIKEELKRIEQTIELLYLNTAVQPKNHIKDQLLNGVDPVEKPVIPMENRRPAFPLLQYVAAASIVIAISTTLLAFNYWNMWKEAESRLADLTVQNELYADNYITVNKQLDELKEAISITNNSNYRRIVMNGTENAPDALATVYWNETSQDLFLSIQHLETLSLDQQYQLWAIIDGKPVDMGVFDSETGKTLIKMKRAGSAVAAFAVTIEPRGGSVNPSLETLQVIGNV